MPERNFKAHFGLLNEDTDFDALSVNSEGDDCPTMWNRKVQSPTFTELVSYVDDERKSELRQILRTGSVEEIKEEFTEVYANIKFNRARPEDGFSPLTVVMAERENRDKQVIIEHLLNAGSDALLEHYYDGDQTSQTPVNTLEFALNLVDEPDVFDVLAKYSEIHLDNITCRQGAKKLT